jgi:hypothetical protein
MEVERVVVVVVVAVAGAEKEFSTTFLRNRTLTIHVWPITVSNLLIIFSFLIYVL